MTTRIESTGFLINETFTFFTCRSLLQPHPADKEHGDADHGDNQMINQFLPSQSTEPHERQREHPGD